MTWQALVVPIVQLCHPCVHTYTHTYIPTYISSCIHTYIHTCIHFYIQTNRQTDRHTYILTVYGSQTVVFCLRFATKVRFAPSGGLTGAKEWKKAGKGDQKTLLVAKMFVTEFRKVLAGFEACIDRKERANFLDKYATTPRRSTETSRIELTKTLLASQSSLFEDTVKAKLATCQHCPLSSVNL